MNKEELKEVIGKCIPEATFDEAGEYLNAFILAANFAANMALLKKELALDYLFCLTAIDWKDNITMVYHLQSNSLKHCLVVKVKLNDLANPQIDTVCKLWKTAEFHEREVFDLFGVKFIGHPDLRRIFLDEDWNGWPLRKNYEDENMIAL